MEYLIRINLHAVQSGHSFFLLVWAADSLAAIEKIRGVLIGPGCEYQLDGAIPYRRDGQPVTRGAA